METRTSRKRNRSRNFVAIPVTAAIPLGTLGNDVVIKGSLLGTLLEDLFVISADLTWTLRDITIGETPIQVGIAHDDYTIAEILENLNVSMLGPGTKIEQEQTRRLIRQVGMFIGTQATTGGISLNDGRPIRTKMKFVCQSGKDLAAWARNTSGVSNLATGAVVQIHGKVYGKWIL